MADPMTILALLETGRQIYGGIKNVASQEAELGRRGVDIPWTQQWLPRLAGPLLGPMIQQEIYGAKLKRTEPGLKGVDSADLTAAAMKEMEAARQVMSRQAAYDIQGVRPRFAGAYQSGARERTEMGIKEQYAGQLATALAGISLESQRTAAALQQGNIALAMQESEAAWRKQAAEMEMWSAILEAGLNVAMKSPQTADTAPSMNVDAELNRLGLDTMALYGWEARMPTRQDYVNFGLAPSPAGMGGTTLPDGTVIY